MWWRLIMSQQAREIYEILNSKYSEMYEQKKTLDSETKKVYVKVDNYERRVLNQDDIAEFLDNQK
jgi:hypothetical protein